MKILVNNKFKELRNEEFMYHLFYMRQFSYLTKKKYKRKFYFFNLYMTISFLMSNEISSKTLT